MICVPPFRGEFGMKLRYHVPAVRALPRPVVVGIEPGDEALYPDAAHMVFEPRPDNARRDLYDKDAAFVAWATEQMLESYPGSEIVAPDRGALWPERRFVPEPVDRYGFEADVVVCPRRREYGAEKNWGEWPWLVDALKATGVSVAAAGAEETSAPVDCPAAWEYPRVLDATIEVIRSARLVIATDAGLAHLAVLCGAPLLLIAYGGGLVAPGPVRDGRGLMSKRRYWPIRVEQYYNGPNHTGSLVRMVPNGWERPADVIADALEVLGA